MRNYRIERILKLDGVTPKTDQYSVERIGRIVEIDFSYLQHIVGREVCGVFYYICDKDGNDLSFKAMLTSCVTSLNWNTDKSFITMTTENTIYEFREVKDN